MVQSASAVTIGMDVGACLCFVNEDIFQWRFIGKGELMAGKGNINLTKATWIDLFIYKWSHVPQAGPRFTVQQ